LDDSSELLEPAIRFLFTPDDVPFLDDFVAPPDEVPLLDLRLIEALPLADPVRCSVFVTVLLY
jgi:hypothetical protein